jgi:hypothetical protein
MLGWLGVSEEVEYRILQIIHRYEQDQQTIHWKPIPKILWNSKKEKEPQPK